jgi:hypothetical protein
MSQPTTNAEAREHLLVSITAAYAAHENLQDDDKRTALIHIDKLIEHAHEARKFIMGQRPPAAEQVTPRLL